MPSQSRTHGRLDGGFGVGARPSPRAAAGLVAAGPWTDRAASGRRRRVRKVYNTRRHGNYFLFPCATPPDSYPLAASMSPPAAQAGHGRAARERSQAARGWWRRSVLQRAPWSFPDSAPLSARCSSSNLDRAGRTCQLERFRCETQGKIQNLKIQDIQIMFPLNYIYYLKTYQILSNLLVV